MDTYSCYVRLVYQERQQPTFSLRLVRPPQPHPALIERLRLRSRRYTLRAAEVEQLLEQALARHLGGAASFSEQRPSHPSTAHAHRKGSAPLRQAPPSSGV